MKKIIAISMFLILISGCAKNKNNVQSIVINNLKSKYCVDCIIKFEIANITEKNLYYYISIDGKNENKWYEAVPDLKGKGYLAPIVLDSIAGKKTDIVKWPSKDTISKFKPSIGIYRLVVHIYKNNNLELEYGRFHSNEFNIYQTNEVKDENG